MGKVTPRIDISSLLTLRIVFNTIEFVIASHTYV